MLLTRFPSIASLYLLAALFNASSFLFLFSSFIAEVDTFGLPPLLQMLPHGPANDVSAVGMLADTVDDDTGTS
jgi:hypothetical protein